MPPAEGGGMEITMALLEVQNLKKNFGSTKVLKDISFSLEKGETLSIIGSSGGGKTTLLRCLNFLETPSEGRIVVNNDVLYDGADTRKYSDEEIRKKRLHFGLVFQSFNLFPQYTALENVMLAPTLASRQTGESQKSIKKRAEELLDRMGLSEKMNLYPKQLSGGQSQRVAIARALALHPDILCFDEPTSALDPELTGEVLKVISGLAAGHTTMIIVTHEMKFAHDVADKVIFLDDGYILEQGTPEEVFEHPTQERTRQFLAGYDQ